jgi:hypothetical protein
MLSRWDGCWRWFGDRKDSPWYPSLTQFEQLKPSDWSGVLELVSNKLKERVLTKNVDK